MSFFITKKFSEGHYKESGSEFICTIQPIKTLSNFHDTLTAAKENHPKANHHCYGYRIKQDEEIVEFSSDAGEPNGSAGLPILNVLRSYKLVNISAIVVRYFGGSKLGIPGLINAYKVATINAIQANELSEFIETTCFVLHAKYEDVGHAFRLINSTGATILEQRNLDFHEWIISIPKKKSIAFLTEAKLFHALTLRKI